MSDLAFIDVALRAARPRAVGALLRYFPDLDLDEEAFQVLEAAQVGEFARRPTGRGSDE